PFSITFLQTKHPVPCYGMRLTDGEQTIVYTADTSYQDDWISFSSKADVLITDCNFYGHQDGTDAGHMNSREGALIAEKAGVKELILSHLPQYGSQKQLVEEAKEVYQGTVHLAKEGFIWYVSSYSRSTYNTYICGTLFLYALLATALSLANRIYSIGSKRQEPIK